MFLWTQYFDRSFVFNQTAQ